MKILCGVTAGISIYKIPNVIRMLKRDGHTVRVMMTENSARLVSPLLFKAISGEEVYVKGFDYREPLAHIKLSDWADVFAVMPATADFIAKIASGLSDDLLSTTMLAFNKKKIIFPAMNTRMYENNALQGNLKKLKDYGFTVVEPDTGELACGTSGRGRLPSPEKIYSYTVRDPDEPLKGLKYIVTAGGTVEKIDPVRYISNFSSGKMGMEIAGALFKYGADVLVISAGTSIEPPSWMPSVSVDSTEDMLKAVNSNLPLYDGLFMAGAPADFRPESFSPDKIKKEAADEGVLNFRFVKTVDILKEVSRSGLSRGKLMVGFALETENGFIHAQKKLTDKGLSFIVLNQTDTESGFSPMGGDSNRVILISREGQVGEPVEGSKKEIADWLIRKTVL